MEEEEVVVAMVVGVEQVEEKDVEEEAEKEGEEVEKEVATEVEKEAEEVEERLRRGYLLRRSRTRFLPSSKLLMAGPKQASTVMAPAMAPASCATA